MGARATIRIKQKHSAEAIHFYAHWSGDDIHQILAKGLKNVADAGRLDDETYASRIIFDTLVQSAGTPPAGLEAHYASTGFGIIISDQCVPWDLQYDSPCVEWIKGEMNPVVYTVSLNSYDAPNCAAEIELNKQKTRSTVEEFISKTLDKDLTAVE
tara:strand:- start:1765 stop:2232 length:468 start_codon:yes stop_codon:yes gene_type:complete